MAELSLEVSDNYNPKIIRLFDTTEFWDDTPDNYLIEILPVNKSSWISFPVQSGFSLTLNSSSLNYRKAKDVSGLINLPDGIYEIKQSYKPNLHTLVYYYYLRTTDLYTKIRRAWNDLFSDKCNISREEFSVNRDKLREIEEYALAAKYKVEELHEKKEGKELYEWAVKLLEQYNNECGC